MNWRYWQWDFLHPQHEGLLSQLDVELDERGNIKASDKEFHTNISKIFTAGDMRRGQSLVVWAISEGRECARKVDEYLMGLFIITVKRSEYTSPGLSMTKNKVELIN